MSGGPDTILGGVQKEFPTTIWSSIFQSPDRTSPRFREKIERLVARYWKPIYRTIRITWGSDNEDAKDLTQAFLFMIVEDDFVGRFCPAKGRFRSFIKAALQHFMADQEKARQRLKRGGGRRLLSLDAAEDASIDPEDARGTPDDVLDREWADALLEESIDELREALTAEGHANWYRVYEAIDLADGKVSYRGAGQKLGLTESDVTHYLHAARRRLRTIILGRVGEYSLSEDEAYDELRTVFAG